MKFSIMILTLLITAGLAYTAGYKKGGKDFEYLDHMMRGMIAGVDIDRCDASEYPADCYKLNHQLAMNHSLFFYTKYNNELSPIAKMVFSESYDGYQKSVQKLYDIAHSKTPENLCEFFQTPPEELSACVSDINSFKQRVLNSKIQ
jgi:hypothetical protein